MPPTTPLITRLTELEPKRTALLLKIMERPGMYFGTTRFDYMEQFFSGYDFDAWERSLEEKTPRPINELAEMGYWLLHTHSATVSSCSWSARSLFYRCFGCGPEAFDAYRAFLETSLPQDGDDVWYELDKYKSAHELPYSYDKPKPEILQQMAQTVLDNITELLHRSEITYDQLKIYVRRDTCFLQIRFLYHNESGWADDTALIAKPENHDLLIAIHAHAQNTSTKALQALGIDVLDTRRRDSRSDQYPARHDRPYNLSFAFDYAKWKNDYLPHPPPT